MDNKGWDAVLFGALAVVVWCLCHGRLQALTVLLAGAQPAAAGAAGAALRSQTLAAAVSCELARARPLDACIARTPHAPRTHPHAIAGGSLMGVAWWVNLRELGNAMALWLSLTPSEIFFYIFLPPLLLDAAVKIDFFLFKKVGRGPSARSPGWPTRRAPRAAACMPASPMRGGWAQLRQPPALPAQPASRAGASRDSSDASRPLPRPPPARRAGAAPGAVAGVPCGGRQHRAAHPHHALRLPAAQAAVELGLGGGAGLHRGIHRRGGHHRRHEDQCAARPAFCRPWRGPARPCAFLRLTLAPLLRLLPPPAGGGSHRLRMVMEGESLLNDASSFTLFTVFISYLQVGAGPGMGWAGLLAGCCEAGLAAGLHWLRCCRGLPELRGRRGWPGSPACAAGRWQLVAAAPPPGQHPARPCRA